MTCTQLSSRLCVIFTVIAAASCGDDGGITTITVDFNVECELIGGFVPSCSQQAIEPGEPGLTCGPRFNDIPSSSTVRQAQVLPGEEARATLFVNEATSRAILELVRSDDEELPPISMLDIDTRGRPEINVTFTTPTNEIGRYYMRVRLCSNSDCGGQDVIYMLDPDINAPYLRRVRENGFDAGEASTCLRVRTLVINSQ